MCVVHCSVLAKVKHWKISIHHPGIRGNVIKQVSILKIFICILSFAFNRFVLYHATTTR